VGLIAAVGLGIAEVSFPDGLSVGIFALAVLLLFRWKVHPILVMLASGLAGVALYSGVFA
jgi:chromate transport protein ChrA